MACFLVPTAEAIVTTVIKKAATSKEGEEALIKEKETGKLSWRTKLSWLTGMLWGGAALLCLEHIWHGEVVLYPPFLTAMSDPGDTAEMLAEMSTVGVGMAILVTVAWVIMILVADRAPAIRKRLTAGTAESAGQEA